MDFTVLLSSLNSQGNDSLWILLFCFLRCVPDLCFGFVDANVRVPAENTLQGFRQNNLVKRVSRYICLTISCASVMLIAFFGDAFCGGL
jgi:hypothetical protein